MLGGVRVPKIMHTARLDTYKQGLRANPPDLTPSPMLML